MATSAKTQTLQNTYNALKANLLAYQKQLDPLLSRLKILQSWDSNGHSFFDEIHGNCNYSHGACIGSWTNPETLQVASNGGKLDSSAGNNLYNYVKSVLQNWEGQIATIQPQVTDLQNQIATLNGTGAGSIAQANKDLQDSINADNTVNLSPDEKAKLSKAQNYKTALTVGIIIVILLVGLWAWNKYFRKGA